MIMISKFFFKLTDFFVIICFLPKLLTSGILFSTAVNAVFAAKLLTSGILFFVCFLQHHSIDQNQQEVVLICQCVVYQLQFLS